MTGWMFLQGTNALVVLEALTPAAPGKSDLIWRRRRFWAAGIAHAALCTVAAAGQSTAVVLEARLHSAAVSYMLDHRCCCVPLPGNGTYGLDDMLSGSPTRRFHAMQLTCV